MPGKLRKARGLLLAALATASADTYAQKSDEEIALAAGLTLGPSDGSGLESVIAVNLEPTVSASYSAGAGRLSH